MLYLNQLEYKHIPYPTNVENPDSDYALHGNVCRAGCGLCAICMVIDMVCGKSFSLEECRDLSVAVGANHAIGTDMLLLAPAAAEKFHMALETTDDPAQMARCLHQGGAAIINVGGNHGDHIGTFSRGGHFIIAIGEDQGEFCLLDPSWTPQKYLSEPRRSLVRQQGKLLYATAETLQQDTANRSPAYYLFRRADDESLLSF